MTYGLLWMPQLGFWSLEGPEGEMNRQRFTEQQILDKLNGNPVGVSATSIRPPRAEGIELDRRLVMLKSHLATQDLLLAYATESVTNEH